MRRRGARLSRALIRLGQGLIVAGVAAVLGACASHGENHRKRADGPPPTVYTVKRGDTLYSIAWRHGLEYRDVAAWNGIGPPYTIYPGQEIRLRPPVDDSSADDESADAAAGSDASGDQSTNQSPDNRESTATDSEHDWRWPANGNVVSDYGSKDYGKKGVAIGGESGHAVRASEGGRVVYSGNGLRGYGNLVIVKHGETYLTAYGYNEALLVNEGERVGRGDRIARIGRTPEGQTAVHFELRRDGQPVNPLQFLPAR